jgi:hypothetical protein
MSDSAARTRIHHESHDTLPLLTEPIEQDFSADFDSISSYPLRSRSLLSQSTTLGEESIPASRSSTPRLYDPPDNRARGDEFGQRNSEESASMRTEVDEMPNKVPLLMTSAQRAMVKNLNEHLPHMERVVGWYPWAYNSHATLIVR